MIGKIKSCVVGMGGYQDAQFGISFELGGKGWGVCDFWGVWADGPTAGAKWTAADRQAQIAEVFSRLCDLLKDAESRSVDALVGKPVEVTFNGSLMTSWRILTEAI